MYQVAITLGYRYPAGARVLFDVTIGGADNGEVGHYRYYLRCLFWLLHNGVYDPHMQAHMQATIPDLARDHRHAHSRIRDLRGVALPRLYLVVASGRVNLTTPSQLNTLPPAVRRFARVPLPIPPAPEPGRIA